MNKIAGYTAPVPVRQRAVVDALNFSDIESVVARCEPEQLRDLLDAAEDVARSSAYPYLARTARLVLTYGRQAMPEYFAPDLNGTLPDAG